jgi:hypothetical protein
MITNTNNVGSTPASALDPQRKRAAVSGPVAAQQDTLSTEHATRLKLALDQTPAVRPEQVSRAAALVTDPAYPPIAIIEKVASMIAASNDLSNTQD